MKPKPIKGYYLILIIACIQAFYSLITYLSSDINSKGEVKISGEILNTFGNLFKSLASTLAST